MDMNKLKQCPFCGGEANLSFNISFGFIPWCSNVLCILNELCAGYATEEEAANAWNRRANDEQAD